MNLSVSSHFHLKEGKNTFIQPNSLKTQFAPTNLLRQVIPIKYIPINFVYQRSQSNPNPLECVFSLIHNHPRFNYLSVCDFANGNLSVKSCEGKGARERIYIGRLRNSIPETMTCPSRKKHGLLDQSDTM